jgi:hypothetical protein
MPLTATLVTIGYLFKDYPRKMMILKPGMEYTTPFGRTGSDFVARIDGLNFDRFNNNQVTIYLSIYENQEAQSLKRPSSQSLQEVIPLPDLIAFVEEHSLLSNEPLLNLLSVFQAQARIAYYYLMSLPQWEAWQSDEPGPSVS